MHVHINGEIYNMDRFESCAPLEKNSVYPHRIGFYRGGHVVEYAGFDTKEARDKKWSEMVKTVETWYARSN